MSKVYLAVGDDFEIEDAEMEAGPPRMAAGPPRMAAPLIVVDAVDAPAGPKRCSSCIREATLLKEHINLKNFHLDLANQNIQKTVLDSFCSNLESIYCTFLYKFTELV